MKISKRVESLKPSPTLELVAKAKAFEAEGHDVISLSVGEPDWPTYRCASEAGTKAIEAGKTKYTPAAGMKELRQAIAKQASNDLGFSDAWEWQNVTVTSGAKFILTTAIQCLVNPGEKVIVPKPYWVSYPAMVELAGGESVFVESDEASGFKLTAERLANSLDANCRALFLNSPSNPTGMVYSPDELEALSKVLADFPDVTIISDDIYNRLVFTGELAPHLLQVAPQLRERTLLVNGVSKSYAMTGWRMGWGIGPEKLIRSMSNYQSQTLGCASSVSQHATVAAIVEGEADLAQTRGVLKERLDFIDKAFEDLSPLRLFRPDGAFYVWIDIQPLLGKTCGSEVIVDSRTFCQLLLEKHHVVVVPGQEFGLDGFLRMSFALEKSRMAEALKRIKTFVQSLTE